MLLSPEAASENNETGNPNRPKMPPRKRKGAKKVAAAAKPPAAKKKKKAAAPAAVPRGSSSDASVSLDTMQAAVKKGGEKELDRLVDKGGVQSAVELLREDEADEEAVCDVAVRLMEHELRSSPVSKSSLYFVDASFLDKGKGKGKGKGMKKRIAALLRRMYSSPALTINLLRTSFTAAGHGDVLRGLMSETFDALLSHIDGGKAEYYVAAGWVPSPKAVNELSKAFHENITPAVMEELMRTPAYSRVGNAYAAGTGAWDLKVKVGAGVYEVETLKRVGFKDFPEKLAPLGMAGKILDVAPFLSILSFSELKSFATRLRIVSASEAEEFKREEDLIGLFKRIYNAKEGKKGRSVYPTLKELTASKATDSELAASVPGMYNRTQYGSIEDYVQTQYSLYSQEFHYELSEDMVSSLRRMNPRVGFDGEGTEFEGWSKYCCKVEGFEVVKVGRPMLGRVEPRVVEAVFTLNLDGFNDNIKREWDNWDEANLYLFNVNGEKVNLSSGSNDGRGRGNAKSSIGLNDLGVERVRGCKVVTVTDFDGNELTNQWGRAENLSPSRNSFRKIKVELDPTQFYEDGRSNRLDTIYKSFNVVMRRDAVNNNAPPFLNTLNAILMSTQALPKWLEPTFLGFGEPEDAWGCGEVMKKWAESTPGVPKPTEPIDFGTCFQDSDHIKESFPSQKVTIKGEGAGSKVEFCSNGSVKVSKYVPQNDAKSTPRFTPTQIDAIKSGINPGLTLVVGPPGTGKTDTAVAIITSLVRSFPNQRILMVTHSNAALNDLFEKIVATEVLDERFMIRLGGGEKNLKIDR